MRYLSLSLVISMTGIWNCKDYTKVDRLMKAVRICL